MIKLEFDLNNYFVDLLTANNSLILIPKQNELMVTVQNCGLPGILGPDFEMNIFELIEQTQEKAKNESYK